MTIAEVELLCNERGLPYKGKFLEGLSQEELDAGYMKFNIPDVDNLDSLNGEGVWGWMKPEDKVKYQDDKFYGELTAILCDYPLNFCGILWCGSEVVVQCHGNNRPTLSKRWVEEKILAAPWYQTIYE